MGELSRLAALIEATFDISIEIVSGGNSANLDWVFSSEHMGRVNNLRLGESILLGREALNRNAIDGLHTDAITLVGEVIEVLSRRLSVGSEMAFQLDYSALLRAMTSPFVSRSFKPASNVSSLRQIA